MKKEEKFNLFNNCQIMLMLKLQRVRGYLERKYEQFFPISHQESFPFLFVLDFFDARKKMKFKLK